jgi:signal transduction histidine kinase
MSGHPTCGDNVSVQISDGGWRARYQSAAFIPFVVLLGVGAVAETVARQSGHGIPGRWILLFLAAVATTLPLAVRRPTAAGTSIIAAGLLSMAVLGTLTVAGIVAQLAAAYRLGARGRPAVAVVAVIPYLLIAAFGRHGEIRVLAVLLAAAVPAVALAATIGRMRREDLENRAAHQAIAGSLVEHTARGERARIARELHDVVAHHISMVAVQAETARLTTPGMPLAGAQRLSAIGDTARAALTEMRRLLGVLREDAEIDSAERRPQPSLAQLNDLLDEARDTTGAGTRLILRGPPVALDPGVELAAYRIIQEALTNSRRHAPGAAVDVELHYCADVLRLAIRDNGSGPTGGSRADGHGLLGMRERAAAVGGRLRAGPASTGGFLVEARLPTRAEELR